MQPFSPAHRRHYHTIVIGAGAAGLYFAARTARACRAGQPPDVLLLEKTQKIGTKLLMSGNGQCNLTHAGDIKEFLLRYGKNGRCIRTCLFQHNNLAVCNFFEQLGVKLLTRQDGKIFPASMDAHDIRNALLRAALGGGVRIRTSAAVTSVASLPAKQDAKTPHPRFIVTTAGGEEFTCVNLVVASGGCSYPSTGSDGSLLSVLQRDLGIAITPPRPALTPVYVENYLFSSLSGISLTVQLKLSGEKSDSDACFTGDLLLTHKNFSGPVILNNSRYMKSGTRVEINFLFPYTITNSIHQMKKDFPGNTKTIENWMAANFGLPKRFCEVLCLHAGYTGRKVSTLSGEEMKNLAQIFCAYRCVISGTGSFREAMVTSGGVSLDAINTRTMESKDHPGLYFIGEVLDVDGDTGGYNLQFAFASAAAASSHTCSLPKST